jgi:opacity protein-like surface antigen
MGSLKLLAVAGAVVVGAATLAHAGDLPPPPPPGPVFDAPLRGTVAVSGIYLRGDIGVGLTKHKPGLEYRRDGQRLAVPAGTTFSFLDSNLDSVTTFGAGIGYQFNNWLRFDVTGELRTSSRFSARDEFLTAGARSFDAPGTTGVLLNNQLSGSLSTSVFMANAYVDLGTFCALGCITPFLGAGIGLANHKFSAVTDISTTTAVNAAGLGTGPSNTFTGQFAGKSRTNLAWALMAGASVDVAKNVKLELGYRYLNMGRAETGAALTADLGNRGLALRVKDIDSHDFRLGMRWLLNGGDCCAPEPVYAPKPMIRKF